MRQEFLVDGMTCSHCVASVTEELSLLEGVQKVTVSLVVGGASTISVDSTAPVSHAAAEAAITEAGYTLAAV